MTNDSEDLVVFGRTSGFRQGRVSPGWLSCPLGPACLSRSVSRKRRDYACKTNSHLCRVITGDSGWRLFAVFAVVAAFGEQHSCVIAEAHAHWQ